MCMIQSCFSYCRKVLLVICVFKNVKVRFRAQNCHPVIFFLWLIKSCKNCNRFLDHLEKCGLFSDFQYGFRSSQSTPDLLTVVSDRIVRSFNRSGATRAVAIVWLSLIWRGLGFLKSYRKRGTRLSCNDGGGGKLVFHWGNIVKNNVAKSRGFRKKIKRSDGHTGGVYRIGGSSLTLW